jgi:hypothetical protein
MHTHRPQWLRIPTTLASRTTAAGLALTLGLALAGCGGARHHHTTTSTSSTPSARVEQASVTPGAHGLPSAAKQLFASDGAVPSGNDQTVTPGGSVVASSGFNPARDGFAFQNYGFIAGPGADPGGAPADVRHLRLRARYGRIV